MQSAVPHAQGSYRATFLSELFHLLIISLHKQAQTFWQRIRQLQEEDVPVMVTVVGANRGGLMVQYAHLEGFVPVSQLGQVR